MSDLGAEQEAVVHVVANADLRAGWQPQPEQDPEAVASLSPNKRSALLSNPLLGSDDEPAQILLRFGDRFVGRIDLVAGEVETQAGSVPCFWGSALQVSPAYRGRRLGETLIRASEGFREITGACGASRMARPVYARLGYFDLPLRRTVLIRRTRSLVEPRLGTGPPARAATRAGDLAAAAQRRLLGLVRRGRAGSLGLERRDAFPAELEPRLRERAAPFSLHRSAAWLDWVLGESFADEHRRGLYLVVDAAGEPVAYFLLKARVYSGVTKWNLERFELGSLVDWQIFEPRAVRLEHLVLLALEALDEWDVDGVEVCASDGDPAHLRRFGFLPAGEQHVLFRGGALDGFEARDPQAWSLRPGEGDHVFS